MYPKLKSFIIWVLRNYLFLKNHVSQREPVLYYQQLTIALYQVSFYANNYFEKKAKTRTQMLGTVLLMD